MLKTKLNVSILASNKGNIKLEDINKASIYKVTTHQ